MYLPNIFSTVHLQHLGSVGFSEVAALFCKHTYEFKCAAGEGEKSILMSAFHLLKTGEYRVH